MPRQEDDEQHEQDAVGLTERLVLAMKAGMNLDSLLTALKDGAAGSKAMDQKGEKMIKAEYTPESRLTTSLMDVRLMLEQGQRFGTPMFLTSIYAHICPDRDPDGPAELDPSPLIEVLCGMSGLPLRKNHGGDRPWTRMVNHESSARRSRSAAVK